MTSPLRRPLLVAALGLVRGALAVLDGAVEAGELISEGLQHAAYAGSGVCACRACVQAVVAEMRRRPAAKGPN